MKDIIQLLDKQIKSLMQKEARAAIKAMKREEAAKTMRTVQIKTQEIYDSFHFR